MRTILAVLALFVLPAAAYAQAKPDAEGSKDHPLVPRLPGYYIEDYETQDFGKYTYTITGRDQDSDAKVEGHYWKISYWLNEGARKLGPVEIARNYRQAFARKGGVTLSDDIDSGGGSAVLRLPIDGGARLWMEISVSNAGEVYDLTIVQEAALTQRIELTAADMAAALKTSGSIALRGILFDTAKADIKPESGGLLEQVAALLQNDPSLTIEIQGHTDNVGAPASNLTLSRQRADAVKAWLVTRLGIDAARLTTAGFGDSKPVADNATDAGRALNRRVDLVKK